MVRVFEKFFVRLGFSFSLSFSLSLLLFNRTRVVPRLLCSHGLRYPFPCSILRDQIKNRFLATISVLIRTVRRSKVRYIGAVKLVLQKGCPKGSASPADKTAILHSSGCTRLFLSVFSPLPFESREPFIEENPFNVFFDVTAATPFFFYHSRNHDEARRDFVSLPSVRVSYSVTVMEYPTDCAINSHEVIWLLLQNERFT